MAISVKGSLMGQEIQQTIILTYYYILGPAVPSFSRVLKAFHTLFSELSRSEKLVSKSLYGYLAVL